METTITTQDLEPLPKTYNDVVSRPLGFLNSNYQQIVNHNYNKINSKSLFGIRQRMKSKQFIRCCSAETILKVTLFATVLILAFN